MPTIYDNITKQLLEGLQESLRLGGVTRGDFCVGYLNLRGWRKIARDIDKIQASQSQPACRLIVGMPSDVRKTIRDYYARTQLDVTHQSVLAEKKKFAKSLAEQLTWGVPTRADEIGLRHLAKQLRAQRLRVKFFAAYPLHAKLYLVHRDHADNPTIAYVGSSNLTVAGLQKQGELNVDVVERDRAAQLATWFEDRWEDQYCLDISAQLAEIIETSWAGGAIPPYHIYIKTAYELSKEAIEGVSGFKVPREFNDIMLEYQKQAVSLAAQRLNSKGGVIIGDVVGLGKTIVASAVAKIFQEDQGANVLVICPPKLAGMWDDYLHKYTIAGRTLSLGKVEQLKTMLRFRLIIIDESHNLRNRKSARHALIRDYIRDNDSNVILLSATPYNKQFSDIASQLRLFIASEDDLGIRPEAYIRAQDGMSGFSQKHPNTVESSLVAFERSEYIDDWRELMRVYMVRRTRSYIKKHFAQYDKARKQHFLTFPSGEKFYFPLRRAKAATFSLEADKPDDQYAKLYSPDTADRIGGLNLPRYGLAQYLKPEYQNKAKNDQPDLFAIAAKVTVAQRDIIENLSRAGKRLIGFARTGLFKRLESSGPAFLLSLRRHIVRNALHLYALQQNKDLPVGDVFGSLVDETVEESDTADVFGSTDATATTLDSFLQQGQNLYHKLADPKQKYYKKLDWIPSSFFVKKLATDLRGDCKTLLKVLKMVPEWDESADRKLEKLVELCQKSHAEDKLLIFTQFKDTADYLYAQLQQRGVTQLAKVVGGMDNISEIVKRFSPQSNNAKPDQLVNNLRILVTTDTLSEGQNLQDAHIIVNFDLPWAIIRLIQRAGRVDRIGQTAKRVLCYCFLPEKGIEKIINLRERLQARIKQGAELVGSDERFFEGDEVNLHDLYAGKLNLDDDSEDDETDLISRAYDIWHQAIKDDSALEAQIKKLPDVVYSAKRAQQDGAIAYIKTNTNVHILAQLDPDSKVVSQSQSKMLDLLACEPDEPAAEVADAHHQLVAAAVAHVKEGQLRLGGQLGGANSIRKRAYDRLQNYYHAQSQSQSQSLDDSELKAAIDLIYQYPLQETARDRLGRQLRAKIRDADLAAMVQVRYQDRSLCIIPKEGEPLEPQIICSMGLRNKGV